MNGTPARASARTTPRNHKRKDRNVLILGNVFTHDDAASMSQQRTQKPKHIPSTHWSDVLDQYICVYIY